jgi:hypothetical protein
VRRLATVAFCFVAAVGVARSEDVWSGVERIVAVGDVHGDYEGLAEVLRSAGLIDSKDNWAGGKTHLVQLGDVPDRGPDSRKAMDLLMKLEKQALRAGGCVHVLIGNHEAMNVYGDLRYVSDGEYAAFARDESAEARRLSAKAGHRPGYVEHRRQYSETGKYGRWIRGRNTIVKINDTVFVHGGISEKYAGMSIRSINERVREELNDFSKLPGGIVTDSEGPLWYRGLARGEEAELRPVVDRVLESLSARRIVVGHTVTEGAIVSRFGGKVVLADVGLSRVYDPAGRRACLVLEENRMYALHRGERVQLSPLEASLFPAASQ